MIELIEKSRESLPVALTVAGFDGSGGAGVLADVGVMRRHGVYGIAAVTAVVAQRPGIVRGSQGVDSVVFGEQLELLFDAYPIQAIKVGMLGSGEILNRLVEVLGKQKNSVPIILDPVLKATAGAALLEESAIDQLKESLFPLATLVTPNHPEAETLLGMRIQSVSDVKSACQFLADNMGCSVLLKGGHFSTLSDRDVVDYFYDSKSGELISLSGPRLDVPDLHGTGCQLSSAIAARIARGEALIESIQGARDWLLNELENYHSWQAGGEPIFAIRSVD